MGRKKKQQVEKEQKKFLVIQQKMIGDVLTSTVICESLKHYFPGALVYLVANENTLAVLENNPHIDEVIVFKNEYRTSKIKFFSFLKTLKKRRYSATLDAYGKLESNLITLFSKADKKIGNSKWYTSWVYSDTIKQKQLSKGEIPLSISNRLMLLNPLIKENNFITYPKIYLDTNEIEDAQKSIATNFDQKKTKLIMISIVGSAPYKTYPAKYMARILDLICEENDVNLMLNYIPNQKNEALAIYNLCSPTTRACIAFDFYADSLRGFLGLLSQCDMLIGNEGGAVNMAKALSIPSFAIFSPYIKKNAWAGKTDQNHESVHLADYHPELFHNKDKAAIKKNSATLYQVYEPKLFKTMLSDFLTKNFKPQEEVSR